MPTFILLGSALKLWTFLKDEFYFVQHSFLVTLIIYCFTTFKIKTTWKKIIAVNQR